ncbi:MAG: site-specific DNA-methyltransferase [Endomicrobium sp.]|jgi:modification methylase|nr:site-specific DNA-methyltransferase [Endomicrobium sp.]
MSRIILGDVLQELKKIPDNSVDIGVTSPPYNKGEKQKGWLVKNVEYDVASDKKDEHKYQQEQIEVLNELFRIMKPCGSLFYNHKLRWDRGQMLHPLEWLIKTNWAIKQELVWDRSIAANIRGWKFWQVEERIYWLYKAVNGNLIGEELKSKHALLTSVWRFAPERKIKHPAPFPLQLPLRCIYSVLDDRKNCVVIDPYAGSGTTLVAAKMLGHSYIGIDISRNYVDMASKRLKNYKSELKAFDLEVSKHVVKKTVKDRKNNGVYNRRSKTKQIELTDSFDLFSALNS